MGGRGGGGGQRLLDGFRRKGGSDGHCGRWDDAIVMRLCRPVSLGNGRTVRRSEKCSLKMLIARVAFLEAVGGRFSVCPPCSALLPSDVGMDRKE